MKKNFIRAKDILGNDKLVKAFYSKIGEWISPSSCWEWQGTRVKTGYGRIVFDWHLESAHRFSYRMHRGEEIPDGMFVCHSCDNPRCVNPDHLWIGTTQENSKDRNSKNRLSRGRKHSEATRAKAARGEVNPSAKLTAEQVLQIVEMRSNKVQYKTIAQHFGVSVGCLEGIMWGYNWTHVTKFPKKEKRGSFPE